MGLKKLKVSGTYSLPYVIEAEWTTYLVFSIIFVPIALLWAFISLKGPSTNAWQAVLVTLGILSVFLVWAKTFRIILKEDRLIYKTLFSKANEILFSNIVKLEISIGFGADSARKNAFYRLNIVDKTKKENLTINMKPFSRRDLAILVDSITAKNMQIEMDELVKELKDGNFAAIVSRGIKQFWQVALFIFWIFLAISLIRGFLLRR